MKTLIVDDESRSRSVLRAILERFHQECFIVGEASNIQDAEEMINELEPDLVFLDVEMPTGTGFNLLQKLKNYEFDVIFTTAHSHYAVQAIRHEAFDYLVKPIIREELAEALGRLERRVRKSPAADAVVKVEAEDENGNTGSRKGLDYLEPADMLRQLLEQKQNRKIYLPDSKGVQIVMENEILRCEAESNYCVVYTSAPAKYTVSKPLKDIERMLDNDMFFRIHYSNLINLNKISRISHAEGGFVILSDGTEVGISKRRKKEFFQIMGLK